MLILLLIILTVGSIGFQALHFYKKKDYKPLIFQLGIIFTAIIGEILIIYWPDSLSIAQFFLWLIPWI